MRAPPSSPPEGDDAEAPVEAPDNGFKKFTTALRNLLAVWLAIAAVAGYVMKDSSPHHTQSSALKVYCAMMGLGRIVNDGIMGNGSMHGEWTHSTAVLVFDGLILKTLSNQYLSKGLDDIWKDISEAIGVLLEYFTGGLLLLRGLAAPAAGTRGAAAAATGGHKARA